MPKVALTADHQGKKHIWLGQINCNEGMIDRDTGMVMLVAQIPDPFNRNEMIGSKSANTAALPIGLFVEAMIQGRRFNQLAILPTSALFENNYVAVLDQNNQLRIRAVKVLKRERKQVIIQAGLKADEQVLISGLLQPVEGMQVTPELLSENDKVDNKRGP